MQTKGGITQANHNDVVPRAGDAAKTPEKTLSSSPMISAPEPL